MTRLGLTGGVGADHGRLEGSICHVVVEPYGSEICYDPRLECWDNNTDAGVSPSIF